MKILKRGIPPAEMIYRVKCRQCNSELEFARAEAQLTNDQRDGDYLTVICPVCGGAPTIDVNSYIK